MESDINISRQSRKSESNPIYGRTQSQQTRDTISKYQHERYERMKEKIHHTTMDEFLQGESLKKRIAEILREELMKLIQRKTIIPL